MRAASHTTRTSAIVSTERANGRSSSAERDHFRVAPASVSSDALDCASLRPSASRAQHVACVAAKPSAVEVPKVNKFQEFGRQYWPAFAALEGVALVGATVNGILSRKRREEIERLNAQMRGIMAKLDEREKTLMSEDGGSESSEALAKAKTALSSDHNESAAELFAVAIDVAMREKDAGAELSARKGLAMALAAQRKFAEAASNLERCLERSRALNQTDGDSVVYGLLGDVYTDLGDFAKAGSAYDMCIRVLDD